MYSIDQFSKITNINKLVLRTWENRYGLFKASRTNTNIRVYSDDLLIQALNIKTLTENGYKISFLAKKKHSELNELLDETVANKNIKKSAHYYVNKFLEAAVSYDTVLFEKTYKNGVEKFGVIDFYQNVILLTFSKIGLIFAKLLLIQNGYEVIYLGANVPLKSLDHIAQKKSIDNILFFSISNFSKENIINSIEYIHSRFKKSKKFLVSDLHLEPKIMKKAKTNIISNINQFLNIIQK